jgi:hypothetical protein
MRTVVALVLFTIGVPCPTQASHREDEIHHQTLERALLLAGSQFARLPITVTSVRPPASSEGVEGWTIFRPDGTGERIFVYAGTDFFRCASWPLSMSQCLLRVASVIVHEAWHFRNGRSEAGAYEAQIAFLSENGGSVDQIASVRRTLDRVRAAERKATEAARKRYREDALQ